MCAPAAADLCLSPEGRGLLECNVQVPNEYLKLIPKPTDEDVRSLIDIAANVTNKYEASPLKGFQNRPNPCHN